MNVLKILFNPIFLLAAGLHAGLLLIPVAGGSSDAVVPAPDPEGESITVTRIPPKATQPAKPAAKGAPTPTARPTTAGVVAAVQQRPATTAGQTATTAQQGTAQTRRTQSRQASSSSSNSNTSNRSSSTNRRRATGNADGSNRNRNNRSNQTANRNSNNEIAVLPSNNNQAANNSNQAANNSSTNTSPTSRDSDTGQTPPTLVALKQGAQSREVPNLLQEILARLQHSVRHTTEPEMEEIQKTWLTTLSEQTGLEISETKELDEAIEISYPFIDNDDGRRFLSCLTPVPEKGLVGVMVDADGAIATEPTLLRSSGYAFLNDIALEKIQDYTDFPEENASTAYTVNVDVDYNQDTCVDLAKLTKL